MKRILIVDDDQDLAHSIQRALVRRKYAVTCFTTLKSFKQYLDKDSGGDLVLLDIDLPDGDGLEFLSKGIERNRRSIPVILLTGENSLETEVLGLTSGAEDYISKPVNLMKLIARIEVVMRRVKYGPSSIDQSFEFQGWRLDTTKRQLSNPSGALVNLSKNQYNLLLAFLKSPNKTFSREALYESTFTNLSPFSGRAIDLQVSRLRRILTGLDVIQTIRGQGYLFFI